MNLGEITAKIKLSDVEVFENVANIIQWYYDNCDTVNASEILAYRDRLATLSYNVAHISAEFKSHYNGKYYIRKIETAKSKQGFITAKGKSAAAAEVAAMIDTQDLLKNEIEAEAASYKIDILLKQINKILEAMNQRIAFVRAEEYTNRQQGHNG